VPAPPTGSTPADGLLVATGVTEAAGAGADGVAVVVVGTTLGVGLAGGVVGGAVVGGGVVCMQVQVGAGLVGGVVGCPQLWSGLLQLTEADAAVLNTTVEPAARSGTLSAAVAISLRGRFCRKFM
jgi:hypothetical protein